MKRKCFSVEQIVAVLKRAELGMSVADLIRHVGISEWTFFVPGRSNTPVCSQIRYVSSSSCRTRTHDSRS